MSPLEWVALALLLGVVSPGVAMAARGAPRKRLVGLEFASVGVVMALMVLAVAWQQSWGLVVPLTLAFITFPGTLVYTRLLTPEP